MNAPDRQSRRIARSPRSIPSPVRHRQHGAALILVLVLLTGLAPLGLYALDRAMTGYYQALALEHRTQATFLAEGGIELGLHRLSSLGPLSAVPLPHLLVPETTLGEGSVAVEMRNNPGDPGGATDTDQKVILRATGLAAGQAHRRVLEALVELGPLPFPTVPGALVMGDRAEGVLTGSHAISGFDSGVPGAAVAGVAFETPGQSLREQGAASVSGTPDYSWGAPAFSQGDGFSVEAQYFIDRLAVYPGAVHISGRVQGDLGTPGKPQVTVVDAGKSATLSGKTTGAGILVVLGDLGISGQFRFDGLVLVDGDANLAQARGNADLVGALVVTPPTSEHPPVCLRLSGNGMLQYSSLNLQAMNGILVAPKVRSYRAVN